MAKKTSVLIVGAGPTGLVLALWLKKNGVDFRIVDKSKGPGETSRALAVQARTLEFYRQLGIDEKILGLGIQAKEFKLRRRGRVVARARLGALGEGISPYPYLLFCSQDVHEAALCEELARLGVKIERGHELLEFHQDEKSVRATLRSSAGEEAVEAEYIVGCDGAHSAVRRGLGGGFPGGTYSQVFFVADVEAPGGSTETDGLQVSLSKKDFCIIMPIRQQNSIRLTGVVPPESEHKEKITFADVADSVARNTGLHVTKVNWFSFYHVHHRVADRFRDGRVFLAGDAAHIHSPAGGQGMNTGIGDAINLAWKLAEVLHGRAGEKLLSTYEPERRAFALTLVATTDTAFQVIASRSFWGGIFRAYILPRLFSGLARFDRFLRFAFLTVSQVRIKYRKSALSRGGAGEVLAGDRLPWVPMGESDNFLGLRTLRWQLHVYGRAQPPLAAAAKKFGISLEEFPWSAEAAAKGLKEDALYFVRPDGYVGFASEDQNEASLAAYLSSLSR